MDDCFLVTGCGGFIASKLIDELKKDNPNQRIIGIDNFLTGYQANIPDDIFFYEGDCADKELINLIFSKHNISKIFHFAAQSSGEISFDNPEYDLKTNTLSTLYLLDKSVEYQVDQFIFASTMSVYGDAKEKASEVQKCNPKSFYGVGKLASENYLSIYRRQFNLNCISLRLFNVYGPGQNLNNLRQGMVSIFLAQLMNSKDIEVHGSLKRFRDLIYIDDVTRIILNLTKWKSFKFNVLNIGTGLKTSVEDIILGICNALGLSYKEIRITHPKETLGDINGIYANNERLLESMPMEFIKFDQGILKMVESIND